MRLTFQPCFLLAVFLLGALASGAEIYDVAVEDDEFIPKTLTVAPGDTVRWTNTGGSAHTVTADGGEFDSSTTGSYSIPAEGTYSFTFTTEGRFPYYCLLHGAPGGLDMSGVIRVVAPSSNTVPATPTNVAPPHGTNGLSTSPVLTASPFTDTDEGDAHAASHWLVRDTTTGQTVLDTGAITTSLTSLALADLENGRTYAWSVRYRDDRDGWSGYSTETQFTTISGPTTEGTGLTASYAGYNRKADRVAQRVFTRVDPTVNFDWRLGAPARGIPANNFFAKWEGEVLPEHSEAYRFRIKADGGVRLWVNGTLIIDDWVPTPFAVFRNGKIALEAGVPATIKLEYFDTTLRASVALSWSSPSQTYEVIPQVKLFPLAQ